MKSTVVACSNLALIKYWGNRNDTLNIPINDSISVSLKDLQTTTTVEFRAQGPDSLQLNDKPAKASAQTRFLQFMDNFRRLTGIMNPVRVMSRNDFPTAAGVASSSSGFGALAHALYDASELEYTSSDISRLARLGSGSAARSPIAGVAHWIAGHDHLSSYAVQLAEGIDMKVLVILTDQSEKKISSIEAMTMSKMSSPFFKTRGEQSDRNIPIMKDALLRDDFETIGRISQEEANNLHAVINTTNLGIYYWNPTSLGIMKYVNLIREEYGIPSYYTIDAGPQIKILVRADNAKRVTELITEQFSGIEIIESGIGFGSVVIEDHLF